MGDIDERISSSLYPLHRCKILHLVRHGQGFHNVAQLTEKDAALCYEYFDASLTPIGWQQVDNLRRHISENGILSKVELVVTSPLLRTMQTAVGVFGGGDCIDNTTPPLMIAGGGNSNHTPISSTGCPPVMAVEWCREHLGVLPCDKRRSISEYRPIFPAIDFSLIEADEDILWQPDVREKEEEIAARGIFFYNWLWTRKEKEIAIVSHGGFLRHTLALFGVDCDPSVRNEICNDFTNCELRSMVLTDRSAIGKSLVTTDYPGGVPPGPDVPSDNDDKDLLANEKASA
ncbi:hypothetical protein SUGI_0594470 [Cryptomeria japonica]|uniref:phosphoglycerate mutase-like protein 1 isoform X2 n=1 Tax=Cryptomeria japonica TaxID=3369 RepID=UPI002414BC71|nr:phosphoglycerate mutase-like protein 1 isoform X2 [Cryptomeria japonica]XP_057867516.1 phosphoglycerate mutase-like protein 1 isoform X2 [Cryptomeria japonica]GLJ30060.1 hypothetical protein SUGI_0594470 [Cryptomeria japonica]